MVPLDELRSRWEGACVGESPGLAELEPESFCLVIECSSYRDRGYFLSAAESARSAIAYLRYGLIPEILCEGGAAEREQVNKDILSVMRAHPEEPSEEDIATFRERVGELDLLLTSSPDESPLRFPAVVEAFNQGHYTPTSRFDWRIVVWGDFRAVWRSDVVQEWIEDRDDELEHLVKNNEFDLANPAHLKMAGAFLIGYLENQS